MIPAAADIAARIETMERRVWTALANGDARADLALLAPGFMGLYPDGPATREAHAAPLAAGPSVSDWSLSDIRVFALSATSPELALITYRARFDRLSDGVRQDWWISSIWRREADATWRNLFSQDTPAT